MKKFKELSQLAKSEIDKKIGELQLEIRKARVTAGKGGQVKMKELKKTLARLLMLKNMKKS